MSEAEKIIDIKPEPTLQEIEQEFHTHSSKAGWLEFRRACDLSEIQQLQQKMSDLNRQAAKLKGDTHGSSN